jgi:acyl-CoA reductase-like NAD-dependent aldehyde dehydrogenase
MASEFFAFLQLNFSCPNMELSIINPATETLITTLEVDSPATIQQLYANARKAQRAWAQVPLAQRVACIARFSALLATEADQLALTLTEEMGKPLKQAEGEIRGARSRIQFFVEQSAAYLADEWVSEQEMIAWDPLGVIANISAWNYPYLVGVNVFIPALIAGNAVLYKPSEYTSLTGLHIERLLHQAGIPPQVFQMVTGGAAVGEVLLQLPLDGYFFTGSQHTGQYIYQQVAPRMVPCQMELGGKDPLYVSADNAQIEVVAAAAAEGAFYNSGQSCCAVERIYVHEAVYPAFVEAFVAETRKLKVGDPMAEDTDIGPLTRAGQVDFLQKQVGEALLQGGQILVGEERWEGVGHYFIPTVVGEVNHRMRLMREESFGPVIGIQRVRNDEEAVQLMRDTEYGLTAAVYADHWEKAEPLLRQMHTGSVYWNCCDRLSPTLPWSGRKHSGIGSTLSYLGIRAFVQPKAFHLAGKR